jgi:hypothetical protein
MLYSVWAIATFRRSTVTLSSEREREVFCLTTSFHVNLEFMCVKVSMVHLWNDSDRIKPKYLERNLTQCHFLYRKRHVTELVTKSFLCDERQRLTDMVWHPCSKHCKMEHLKRWSPTSQCHPEDGDLIFLRNNLQGVELGCSYCASCFWHSFRLVRNIRFVIGFMRSQNRSRQLKPLAVDAIGPDVVTVRCLTNSCIRRHG